MRRTQRDIATVDLIESMLPGLLLIFLSAGLVLLLTWTWVLVRARRQAPNWRGTILMVCGHRLDAGRPSHDYRVRLAAAADRLETDSSCNLLLLGGGQPSEAAAGRAWLIDQRGIAAARIRLEETSVDSVENLSNARILLAASEQTMPDVGLLSSRYHLGRLEVLAKHARLNVTLLPAEPVLDWDLRTLKKTLAEGLFLIWFLSGRFWARLARRPRLLVQLDEE